MKKQLIAVAIFVATIAALTGVALAWFNTRGKILGLSFQTTEASLLINGEKEWNAALEAKNIYPGWESGIIAFTLQNASQADLTLRIKILAQIIANSNESLVSDLQMGFRFKDGNPSMNWQSLSWWREVGLDLYPSNLAQQQSVDCEIQFRLPNTISEQVQNDQVNLELLILGEQI